MQAKALAAALVLFPAVGLSQASAQEEVIDRAVAVVRPRRERAERPTAETPDELITLSELRFEAAVALVQRGGTGAATATLDRDTLRSALEYAIAQRLHSFEADKLRAFAVDPAELDAATRDFEAKLGGAAALDRFLARQEFTRAELRHVLSRGLRAAHALDNQIRLRAQVGESDMKRFYDSHQQEYPGGYEANRAAIRERLFAESYARLAREETRSLRAAADVRLFAGFGDGP